MHLKGSSSVHAMYLQCTCNAPTMHLISCTCSAPAMLIQCTWNAPSMHLQCTYNAPAMDLHCIYIAQTMHLKGTLFPNCLNVQKFKKVFPTLILAKWSKDGSTLFKVMLHMDTKWVLKKCFTNDLKSQQLSSKVNPAIMGWFSQAVWLFFFKGHVWKCFWSSV